MKTSTKTFTKILWYFIYALPAVLFFSYYPIISFGSNQSMNFELSLPLIWLVLFDLGAFVLMIMLAWNNRHSTRPSKSTPIKPQSKIHFPWGKDYSGLSDRHFFLLAIFPLYLTISIFWSANQLRGLLTAGIVWLIFFAVFAMLYLLPLFGAPHRLRTHALHAFFISSALVCIYCFIQSIMDISGLSRDTTLLCAGCTYRSFGFPHPSGFAIEPQFMGNLLLAPTLTALYLVVFRSRNDNNDNNIVTTLFAGLFSLTLFFTFSRGAIYAYGIALIVLIIFALKRHQFSWKLIFIPLISFILSLGLQGTFAAVGPTAETFTSAVTKSIHQLSLGVIDLRPQTADPVENYDPSCGKLVENSSQTVENPEGNCAKPVENSNSPTNDTIFDGYIAESTNIRLNLNKVALWTWASAPDREGTFPIGLDCHGLNQPCNQSVLLTPTSLLFGVGLGGAGTAMHAKYPNQVTSPKEIVQHEGFSLLLETGLVGVALAIFGLLIAFFPNLFSQKFLDGRSAQSIAKSAKGEPIFWHHPALPLLLSLIIAYLVTLNFFSGLPNALQIYLMPPLLYLIFQDSISFRV